MFNCRVVGCTIFQAKVAALSISRALEDMYFFSISSALLRCEPVRFLASVEWSLFHSDCNDVYNLTLPIIISIGVGLHCVEQCLILPFPTYFVRAWGKSRVWFSCESLATSKIMCFGRTVVTCICGNSSTLEILSKLDFQDHLKFVFHSIFGCAFISTLAP